MFLNVIVDLVAILTMDVDLVAESHVYEVCILGFSLGFYA